MIKARTATCWASKTIRTSSRLARSARSATTTSSSSPSRPRTIPHLSSHSMTANRRRKIRKIRSGRQSEQSLILGRVPIQMMSISREPLCKTPTSALCNKYMNQHMTQKIRGRSMHHHNVLMITSSTPDSLRCQR